MYTVLGSTRNRTLRVIWTLEELGVPYNQIAGMPGSREAKVYSKTGKVPALILDGEVFTDSIAIIYFLSDLHILASIDPKSDCSLTCLLYTI